MGSGGSPPSHDEAGTSPCRHPATLHAAGHMIDHFGINCADLEASKRFYDSVLEPLGFTRQLDVGVGGGYGRDGHPAFWISGFHTDTPNREMHLAFEAADAEHVRAFHAAATGLGDAN